jgi:hypothetical protein
MTAAQLETLRDILLHLREARRIVARAVPLVAELLEPMAREILVDLEITLGVLDYTPEEIELAARGGGRVSWVPPGHRPSWADALTH